MDRARLAGVEDGEEDALRDRLLLLLLLSTSRCFTGDDFGVGCFAGECFVGDDICLILLLAV